MSLIVEGRQALYQLIQKTNTYLNGCYKIRKTNVPRYFIAGLVGVILLYISVAGMISVNAPWLVRGDTTQHVDYVWRIYNGELPKRSDGITYEPFVKDAGRYKPQAASKSPPLFYLIHAPIIGPLLDSGEWGQAIAVGRAINIFIGVLCILVISWGAWLISKRHKAAHALVAPALSVLIFRFTRLNVDFALDILLILFSSLSLIYNYKLIKQGPKKRNFFLLLAISILGMLTKISFLPILATNILTIGWVWFYDAQQKQHKIVKSSIVSLSRTVTFTVIVLVASGWYYYIRDYKISGNWFNAVPFDHEGSGRELKSLREVVTGSKLWSLLTDNIIRSSPLSVFIAGLATGGVVTSLASKFKAIKKQPKTFIGIAMLTIAFTATFVTQIHHAMGSGSINFRYLLPAVLPFGLFLSCGLLSYKKTRGFFAISTVLLMAITSIRAFASNSKIALADGYGGLFGGMFHAANQNGVPGYVVNILIASLIVGGFLFSMAIFQLTNDKFKTIS